MDLRLVQEVLFPQPSWGACLPQAEQITGEHVGKLQEIEVFATLILVTDLHGLCQHSKLLFLYMKLMRLFVNLYASMTLLIVILEVKLNAHRTEAQLQGSMTP